MNDAEDPSSTTQKPGRAIRFFLIALPVGLAFMVPISLFIYYKKKYAPKPVISEYAAALRSDLNDATFAHYEKVLAEESPKPGLDAQASREARANFIASTMDYANMGYILQRQTFEAEGQTYTNLVAELPGKSRAGEVVLVLADYDGEDVKGIAALMSLAHALTGSQHARIIRFAAVSHAQGLEARSNGVDELAKQHSAGPKITKTIVTLSPSLVSLPESWKQATVRPLASLVRQAPEDMTGLRQVQETIESEADKR